MTMLALLCSAPVARKRRDVLKVLNRVDTLIGELPVIDSLSEVFGAAVVQDDPSGLLSPMSLQGRSLRCWLRCCTQ